MIKFNDNELEAAIITYNRSSAIQVTLETYAKEYIARNIKLSIYDSSEENDTFEVVQGFNELHGNYVEYHRVDSSVEVGDKPILAMLESECEYIWVQPDKRTANFYDLDGYIFPKIKENCYKELIMTTKDYISKHNLSDEKEYDDVQKCFMETIEEQSWVGKVILKTDIFYGYNYEKITEDIRNEFQDELPGYRFLAFIILVLSQMKSDFRGYMHRVNIDFYLDNGVKSWQAHYYRYLFGEWVVLWKYLTKKLPDSDDFIKNYFSSQDCKKCLFTDSALYFSRIKADLYTVYDEFSKKKFFDYIPIDKSLLEFYAKAPIEKVRRYYLYDRRHPCSDDELLVGIKIILPKLRQTIKPVYIYGAGHGGRIVLTTLKREKISIAGFVDKNAENIKKIDNINVFTLDKINSNDGVLIISLLKILDEVKDLCIMAGFRDNMYYLCDIVARPEEYDQIWNV